MTHRARWAVIVGVTTAGAAAAWVASKLWWDFDAQTSATVASLIVAILGGPLAAWAQRGRTVPGGAEAAARVFNAPFRSPAFTGRDREMTELRRALNASGTAVLQALHGLGGVGKTTLAIEYCHRYRKAYRYTWWVLGERHPSTLASAALVRRLSRERLRRTRPASD